MKSHTEKLTIAIPTYNRWEQLNELLKNIQNGMGAECSVIVRDNNSDRFDEDELYRLYPDLDLTIFRNKENVGVIENTIRAVENVSTKYLLIHSDDDPYDQELISDAIDNIKDGKYVAAGAVSTEIDAEGNSAGLYPERNLTYFVPLMAKSRLLRRSWYFMLPTTTGKVNFFYAVYNASDFTSMKGVMDKFKKNPYLFLDEIFVYGVLADGGIYIQKQYTKKLLQGNKKDYGRKPFSLTSFIFELIERCVVYYSMSNNIEKILIILLAPAKIIVELMAVIFIVGYRHFLPKS